MENKGTNLTPEQALDRLEELYEQSVNALREAIADYVDNGTLPDPMPGLTDCLFILRCL